MSTDVLGRVVEIVEGAKLGEILSARIFEPLGMDDTAFFIPPLKASAGGEANVATSLHKPWRRSESHDRAAAIRIGGGGLLSTIGDYARFAAMLSSGVELDGVRILGPRMIRFMASDHLGSNVDRSQALLAPGHGFGLGFGVRLQYGLATTPGSVGDYFWGGWAGTTFGVSPQDSLFAIFMTQAPDNREHFGWTFGNLLKAAIL